MRLPRSFIASILALLTTASHADNSYIVTYMYDVDTIKLRSADGDISVMWLKSSA